MTPLNLPSQEETSSIASDKQDNALPKATVKLSKPSFGKTGASPAWNKLVAKIERTSGVRSWDVQMNSLDLVATGFMAHFKRAIKMLSNARVFSQWGEELCQTLGIVTLHHHKDVKGSDGLSDKKEKNSIKSLSDNGVIFQMSVFTGAKRTCTFENLEYSINHCPIHTVVDITDLRCIRITSIPKEMLLRWLYAGILTPSGFSTPEEFYHLVSLTSEGGESFEVDGSELAKMLMAKNAEENKVWLSQGKQRRPAIFKDPKPFALPSTTA
jgi:hypothetical protein